jgi:hypothetical protein
MKRALAAALIQTSLQPCIADAASAPMGNAWFYSTAEPTRWCAFTSAKAVKAAAASGRFDGGQSIWLRYHGSVIHSVLVTTESEDAYAEDTYSFDQTLRITQVTRRGHYINDPFFSVTFTPDASGKLRLTPASQALRRRQEHSKHETYFLDWPLYTGFARFPFAPLVKIKPAILISATCRGA